MGSVIMEINTEKQENLRFDGVKFFSVNFNIIGSPKENTDIDLNIVPKVSYESNTKFSIIYDLSLSVNSVFKLEINAVGYFQMSEESANSEEVKNHFVHTNAPAIVFPYLRSFISMFTSNLGTIPTLTLPTHFFKGKLEEFKDI